MTTQGPHTLVTDNSEPNTQKNMFQCLPAAKGHINCYFTTVEEKGENCERKLVTKVCAMGWLQLNELSVPNSDFATLHHTDRQSQMMQMCLKSKH